MQSSNPTGNAMLPKPLASSYQLYKSDTKIFTTWLSEEAAKCGWQPSSQRMKGKARILAKKAAESKVKDGNENPTASKSTPNQVTWTISARDISLQIEIVAESNVARMPLEIGRALDRAIAVRKKFSSWFERADSENPTAHSSHRHFIDILQTAANALGRGPEPDNARPAGPASQEKDPSTITQSYFGTLFIQDADEEVKDASTSAGSMQQPAVYELREDNDDMELVFKIFCFFEDLHSVREKLQRIWAGYAAGNSNIVLATAITTAAIAFIGHIEKEIADDCPESRDDQNSYMVLCRALHGALVRLVPGRKKSVRRGDAGEEPENQHPEEKYATKNVDTDTDNETGKFNEFVMEFLYLRMGNGLRRLSQFLSRLDRFTYPLALEPFWIEFFEILEIFDYPEMQKDEREYNLLAQLIQDFCLYDIMRQDMQKLDREVPAIFDDVLEQALRPIRKEGRVTTQSVFTSRILLDVLDKLGPDFSGGGLLSEHARYMLDSFRASGEVNNVFVGENGQLMTMTKACPIMERAYIHVKDLERGHHFPSTKAYMIRNPTVDVANLQNVCQEALVERIPDLEALGRSLGAQSLGLKINMIGPNPDPAFIFSADPFLCGTMILHACTLVEEAGVRLANRHLSIAAAAHLYNAIWQMNLTQQCWPDMEEVIEAQLRPLFASVRPTTPKDIKLRILYFYNSGIYQRSSTMRSERTLESSPVTKTLLQFFTRNENFDRTFDELEELIIPEDERRQCQKKLTPAEFVEKLEENLPLFLRPMTINYNELARQCEGLLYVIRADLKRRLKVKYDLFAKAADFKDYAMFKMVMGVLQDNLEGGQQLRVAAEAFERVWKGNISQTHGKRTVLGMWDLPLTGHGGERV